MNESTDRAIVKRIHEGDTNAFTEFVRKHQRAVHGYAYHKTRDPVAAEDITQEVFLAAYTNLHQLREPEKAGPWLRSIAQFKSIDWLRQRPKTAYLTADLPSSSPSTIDKLVHQETKDHLDVVLQTLSETNRITFALKYMEGLSNREIADFLGVSQSVVATRLSRVREQLREHLLSSVEESPPRRDFSKAISYQIQAVRPIIGVGVRFPTHHPDAGQCNCIWTARSLAKRTDGICREYPSEGFVVWYGVDRIREDDALRAVETALVLHHETCPLGTHMVTIGQVLSGIPTGESAFPYLVGSDESHLEHGQILVDSTIAWLVRDRYEVEEISEAQKLPNVHRLIPTELMNRFPADMLVGRDGEVDQLETAVHELIEGKSGIIQITGAAGIGKTYLLQTLRYRLESHVEAQSLSWIATQMHRTGPHTLIRQVFECFLCSISIGELENYLDRFGLARELPYFAEWLHLPVNMTDKASVTLTAEQIRYRAFRGMCDWLTQMAQTTRIVWVVDDAHWLSSEESRLLQYLCRVTRNAPILFIFIRRTGYSEIPEAAAGAELEGHVRGTYAEIYREIHLEPLEAWVSHSLLTHHLGDRKLLPSQQRHVLELAGGNPLYLREAAHFLSRDRAKLGTPPNVERLILAHLDSLPPAHQNLLRYASVVGARVDLWLLRTDFPESILSNSLEHLIPLGWLRQNDETYLEWGHALYQESIYHSIEPKARRQLHTEIAGQLKAAPATTSETLADHYHMAGETENAARHAAMALIAHQGQQQNVWTQRYAEIALTCPQVLSREQYVEVLRQYASRLRDMGNLREAIVHLEQALDLTTADAQRVLLTLELVCTVEDYDHKMALLEKVSSWINETTETDTIVAWCVRLAVAKGDRVGRLLSEAERLLQIVRNRGNSHAEARLLNVLAQAHFANGDLATAQSICQQAIQIAETLGDEVLLGDMEYGMAYVLWLSFRYPKAIGHIQRACELYEQEGNPTTGFLGLLGGIYQELGQYEAMAETYRNILEQQGVMEDVSQTTANTHARLVQGYVHLGDWPRAYLHFWHMLDSMAQRPSASMYEIENAVGTLCSTDVSNGQWMWKDIPQTMQRAQELIRYLGEHRLSPEEVYARFQGNLHPILAAGYVEYGVRHSHEEGVATLRLFARQVWILDEHVEFWAYLIDVLDRDTLEAVLEDALQLVEYEAPILPNQERDRPEFFLSSRPEKQILEWLQSCLREHYETSDEGRHLKAEGIIPEPCWLAVGTFEESVPTDVEQSILKTFFGDGVTPYLDWRPPTDVRDGYVDCRHLFDTMERVSAYACTTIVSPREQRVRFTLYHDDSVCVWLNGKRCFEEDHCCYSQFDENLRPGANRVLIRLTNFEDGWGFIVRVTDDEGHALNSITYCLPCFR